MNLLDRLLGHDLAATRDLLLICRDFTDAQMDQEFDAGWRTLRKTFDHMIGNVEVWTDLMLERPVRGLSEQGSVPELLARLDDLWTDVLDDPPALKSYGGAIGHVITHNMHHRAEIQHILYRLDGVNADAIPEGDLMGWDQRARLARGEG